MDRGNILSLHFCLSTQRMRAVYLGGHAKTGTSKARVGGVVTGGLFRWTREMSFIYRVAWRVEQHRVESKRRRRRQSVRHRQGTIISSYRYFTRPSAAAGDWTTTYYRQRMVWRYSDLQFNIIIIIKATAYIHQLVLDKEHGATLVSEEQDTRTLISLDINCKS